MCCRHRQTCKEINTARLHGILRLEAAIVELKPVARSFAWITASVGSTVSFTKLVPNVSKHRFSRQVGCPESEGSEVPRLPQVSEKAGAKEDPEKAILYLSRRLPGFMMVNPVDYFFGWKFFCAMRVVIRRHDEVKLDTFHQAAEHPGDEPQPFIHFLWLDRFALLRIAASTR